MDEDAPSLIGSLIICVVIYVIIPLILAYRRGYFFNTKEKLINLISRFSKDKVQYPKDWTVVKVRPLSKFEKAQIRKVKVKFRPNDLDGYWAEITLKSGRTLYYILGDRKDYWIDDVIDADNILLRSWHKTDCSPYNDIIPIE